MPDSCDTKDIRTERNARTSRCQFSQTFLREEKQSDVLTVVEMDLNRTKLAITREKAKASLKTSVGYPTKNPHQQIVRYPTPAQMGPMPLLRIGSSLTGYRTGFSGRLSIKPYCLSLARNSNVNPSLIRRLHVCGGVSVLSQTIPSRRMHSRISKLENVWICWNCMGRDDISRLRDLSLGGLFFDTRKTRAVGTTLKLDFLVQEGQIRADAVVKYRLPDRGCGVKFTAVTDQDRARFAALMRRLRGRANEIEQQTVRPALGAS